MKPLAILLALVSIAAAELTRIIEDLMKTPPKPKRPNP